MGRVRRINAFTALALGFIFVLFSAVGFGSDVRADGTTSATVTWAEGDEAGMNLNLSGYSDYDVVTVTVEFSKNDIYVSDYPSVPLTVSGEGSETFTITVKGYYHNPNGDYYFALTGFELSGMTASVVSVSVTNNAPSVTPSPTPTATPSPKPATPTPVPTSTPTTAPVAPSTTTDTPTPEVTASETDATPSETEESKDESATPTPTPTGTVTPTPTTTDTPTPTPTQKASPTPTRPPFGDGERDRSEPSDEADPSEEGSIPTKAATNLAAVTTDDNNKKGPGIGSTIFGIVKFLLILAVIAVVARLLILKANGTYNEDLLKEFIPRKKKDPVVEQANAVNGYLQKSNTAAVRPMYSNAPTRPSRFDDDGGIGKSNMAGAKDVSDRSGLSD